MNIRVVLAPAAALHGEGTFFLFEGAYHGSRADYERFIQPFRDAAIAVGGFAGFLNMLEATFVGYMDSLLYANNNALWNPSLDAKPLESDTDHQLVSGKILVVSIDPLFGSANLGIFN